MNKFAYCFQVVAAGFSEFVRRCRCHISYSVSGTVDIDSELRRNAELFYQVIYLGKHARKMNFIVAEFAVYSQPQHLFEHMINAPDRRLRQSYNRSQCLVEIFLGIGNIAV